MDDVMTLIKARRSVGRIQPERAPPRAQIEQLLDAATWAPNHNLTQPWRFIVVAGDARKAMGQMYKDIALADAKDQSAETKMRADVAAKKPMRSPVTIVVVCETQDPPRRRKEDYAACAAAAQNMLLAAHAMGLAAKWNTGGIIDDPRFKQHFGLSPEADVVALVYVGYADGPPPAPPARKSARELTQWRGWPE